MIWKWLKEPWAPESSGKWSHTPHKGPTNHGCQPSMRHATAKQRDRLAGWHHIERCTCPWWRVGHRPRFYAPAPVAESILESMLGSPTGRSVGRLEVPRTAWGCESQPREGQGQGSRLSVGRKRERRVNHSTDRNPAERPRQASNGSLTNLSRFQSHS